MRLIRSLIAALLVAALVVPNTAFAAASNADLEQQILALKRQMEILAHQNAVQQRKIDRLEHRLAAAPVKSIKKFRSKAVAHHTAMPPMAPASVGFSSSPIAQFANETSGVPRSGYQPPPPAETQSPSTSLGKQGPAQGSVQTVYEQQNALFSKGLTITPGATYTYGDNRFFTLNGFMALGAIFLGNINVSRQQNTVFTPNINLSYGASKRLQFDMTVPFSVRSSTYSSAGAQNSSQQISEATVKNAGIGDINAGFFYQLRQKRLNGPIVVLNGHVTAPTGSQPYGIKIVQAGSNDSLSYAKALPTGAGVWGVSAGASIIKTVDPAILFAGATVFYNIQKHFSDISPYQGTTTPGTIAPGSALSLNIGTAFSLNDRMSATFGFQDTIVGSERLRADNGPWQTVGGSSINAAVFNIGTTYAINHHTSWQAMLGIGVTHDAPSFQFSMRFPHGPGQ
jgi:hypothetical protein